MAIPNFGTVKNLVDNVSTVMSERSSGIVPITPVKISDQPIGDALLSNYTEQVTFNSPKQFLWGFGRWGNKTDVVA